MKRFSVTTNSFALPPAHAFGAINTAKKEIHFIFGEHSSGKSTHAYSIAAKYNGQVTLNAYWSKAAIEKNLMSIEAVIIECDSLEAFQKLQQNLVFLANEPGERPKWHLKGMKCKCLIVVFNFKIDPTQFLNLEEVEKFSWGYYVHYCSSNIAEYQDEVFNLKLLLKRMKLELASLGVVHPFS